MSEYRHRELISGEAGESGYWNIITEKHHYWIGMDFYLYSGPASEVVVDVMGMDKQKKWIKSGYARKPDEIHKVLYSQARNIILAKINEVENVY